MVDKMETEAGYLNHKEESPEVDKGSWRGIPGLTEYEHVTYARKDRIDRLLGKGAALATKEFTWAQFSETVFDEWRKAEIEKRIEEITKEVEDNGKEVDFGSQVEIRSKVTKEVEDLIENSKSLNLFSNTLKAYQSRLEIITSKIPEVFENIEGVKGADGYLLVQSGTREENEAQIFGNFESLNNAGGNTKLDRIYSHLGGVTEGHGDKDFFGWKVTVEGHEFVFIWNPDESKENNTKEKDKNEISKTDVADEAGNESELKR